MSEPTIDEMLAIVDSAIFNCTPDDAVGIRAAIRAILEQHREWHDGMLGHTVNALTEMRLKAIRAFVERVEKRVEQNGSGYEDAYQYATEQELAAMEKEAEQ